MDLTAVLWIAVTLMVFVLAIDALVTPSIKRRGPIPLTRRPSLRFGLLMMLFALACSGMAIYEALT